MAACIDLVRTKVKDLTEPELDQVLEQLRARQAALIGAGADASAAAAQAGMEVSSKLRAALAIEKRNAAINFRVRTEALDYLRTTWADNPGEGVLALLYGSARDRLSSRSSANAAQYALRDRYFAGLEGDLTKVGMFEVFQRGDMDQDVARALHSINDEAALKKLPAQAVEIAKVIRRWQDVARQEANHSGAWVGKLDNYIVRQTHHSDRLLEAGSEKWFNEIVPRLDLEKMFPDGVPSDLKGWMQEAFDNITTGIRPEKGDASAMRMAAFKGPGNLAKKASQERVFHFKSADSWFDYNAEYGMRNLREAVIHDLHRSAESTGLMKMLGTNPEYNLQAIVTAIKARLSRADPEALKKFQSYETRIENGYKEVSGYVRQIASQRLAVVGTAARVIQTMSSLGASLISNFNDVATRASLLRYEGHSFLGALAGGMVAPLKRVLVGAGDAEKRAILSSTGYFNENAMGNLVMRFSPDESMPGRLSNALRTYYKWNLVGAWADEMRRSTREAMAHGWGEMASTEWAKLPESWRRSLNRFGAGEKEWEVLRKGIVKDSDGRTFLTPAAIRELDAEQFRGLAQEQIKALKVQIAERAKTKAGLARIGSLDEQITRILEDTRNNVADKIQQLYSDDVRSASIEPDARTNALIHQGTRSGTPMGEILRAFWQFKSFPIAMMQRGFQRELYGYGYGSGKKFGSSEIAGLSTFMAANLGFGYLSISLKALLRGQTPPPPDDYRTYLSAMTQSGGLGIYGDFLFGQSNRANQGFWATLGGPSVGKVDQLAQLWAAIRQGQDVRARTFNFVLNNFVPYNNLFYIRMAANYLFLYRLQEAMNPGYLRRMQRKAEQEQGVTWYLPPAEVAR